MSWTYGGTPNFFSAWGTAHGGIFTVASGVRLLVVALFVGGSTARAGGAPTLNGTAFTAIGTSTPEPGNENSVELWYYTTNAALPSSGTFALPNTGGVELASHLTGFVPSSGACLIDQSVTNTGTGTNAAATISGAAASALVFGVGATGDRDLMTVGANYTLGTSYDDGAFTFADEYDLDSGAAGDVTVNFTLARSDGWVVKGASFIEQAAATNITAIGGDHVQASDLATFTTYNTVTAIGGDHVQASDAASVSIVQPSYSVTAVGGDHAQASDAATLAVITVLAGAGGDHVQSSDAATFKTYNTIAGQGGDHVQSSDAATFKSYNTVTTYGGDHAQTSDAATFKTYNTITGIGGDHTQASDAASVTIAGAVASYTIVTAVLDNFNRADETPLDVTDWGAPFAATQGRWKVVSNQAVPVA